MYSKELNIQILIELLKAYDVHKIVASPGTTNMYFVRSLQSDSFFTIYSAPDERSAAYMACGMSIELREPVVITCTGATASRNYLSGLTEAYYRKIPLIAVTCGGSQYRVGNLIPQVLDRSSIPNDIVIKSINIESIQNDEGKRYAELRINEALALMKLYKMPIHINLSSSSGFTDVCPKKVASKITLVTNVEDLPELYGQRVAVFIGSNNYSDYLSLKIDQFCSKVNGVVLCDKTSNYFGKYKVNYSLIGSQENIDNTLEIDVLLHVGEISGDYFTTDKIKAKQVWRVNSDGKFSDLFSSLCFVVKLSEDEFFDSMNKKMSGINNNNEFYKYLDSKYNSIYVSIPELPFSNVWIAKFLGPKIPPKSVIHLGILNSLRSWNFFPMDNSVKLYSNVGGFGIDGCLSTLIGAAIASQDKLFFCILGDLAFFYDMNSLGNHHLPKNIRILLVNNGRGTEFHNYFHGASKIEDSDIFIAASGHYGNKSHTLVKHYAQDLGIKYISALNKEEFMSNYNYFLSTDVNEGAIIFEVFTDSDDESNAIKMLRSIEKGSTMDSINKKVKNVVGKIVRKL